MSVELQKVTQAYWDSPEIKPGTCGMPIDFMVANSKYIRIITSKAQPVGLIYISRDDEIMVYVNPSFERNGYAFEGCKKVIIAPCPLSALRRRCGTHMIPHAPFEGATIGQGLPVLHISDG